MDFQKTVNPPAVKPPVTLTFSGLMVLEPGPNNTCEVGVHRFNRDHLFQVMLIVNQPDEAPVLIPLLAGPLTAPFTVRLDPDPNPDGGDFIAFAPTPGAFVRNHAANHVKDFRWSINLIPLHPNVRTNRGAEPRIMLKTGVLYTPNLSHVSLAPRLVREGSPDIPLNQIAADLGVSIVPPDGTSVFLEWEDLGDVQRQRLPRVRNEDGEEAADPPGTTYTVSFINYPPNLSDPSHDELAHYYRIMEENGTRILHNAQFSLAFASGARLDIAPCMPVTLHGEAP